MTPIAGPATLPATLPATNPAMSVNTPGFHDSSSSLLNNHFNLTPVSTNPFLALQNFSGSNGNNSNNNGGNLIPTFSPNLTNTLASLQTVNSLLTPSQLGQNGANTNRPTLVHHHRAGSFGSPQVSGLFGSNLNLKNDDKNKNLTVTSGNILGMNNRQP